MTDFSVRVDDPDCDHIIGTQGILDVSGLVNESVVGKTDNIDYFNYCPKCGASLNVHSTGTKLNGKDQKETQEQS